VPRITAYVEALLARYPDDVDHGVVCASAPVRRRRRARSCT
jgi:hypothetical protein